MKFRGTNGNLSKPSSPRPRAPRSQVPPVGRSVREFEAIDRGPPLVDGSNEMIAQVIRGEAPRGDPMLQLRDPGLARITEHQHQVQVIRWCDEHPDQRLKLIFAIPNGGDRTPQTLNYMVAEGLRPGMPDLMLPVPAAEHHGLFVEMKAEDGRLSENQEKRISLLRGQGYCCRVAWSARQAFDCVLLYLGID